MTKNSFSYSWNKKGITCVLFSHIANVKCWQDIKNKLAVLQQTVEATDHQTKSDLQTANEKLQQKDSEIQRISEELTLKRKEADVSPSVIGHIIVVITELCENDLRIRFSNCSKSRYFILWTYSIMYKP